MKRSLTILLFSLLLMPGYKTLQAQTDTEFWFAVPKLSQSHDWDRRRFFIRVATFDLPATITISMPATPGFAPMVFDVPANSARTIPLLSDPTHSYNTIPLAPIREFIFDMWNEVPNVIYNRGVLITATNPITAYFEVGTINNADIFALKGENALGTDFFVPFQNAFNNQDLATDPYSAIYIVATEDNTTVTITPTQPVQGPPLRPAGVPFDIVLNRGQSVAIAPHDFANTGRAAARRLAGTRVVSDKPIAITTSDDSVRALPEGCFDLIGDQIIPTRLIGTEYIAMRSRLNAPVNESFYITGTMPGTQVFVDGILRATIGAGGVYRHIFTQPRHHIRTTQPAYAFHVGGFGCEMGGAIMPPVNVCTGSTEVVFTRSKGGAGERFFLNILVRAGAQDAFIFNNGPINTVIPASAFHAVSGTTQWLAAEFEFTEAQVPVGQARLIRNTEDVFHLALINGGDDSGTMYGYFSDFNPLEVRANISGTGAMTKTCYGVPVQLVARGGTSFSWYPTDFLNDPLISNPIALPERTIKYTVTVSGACGMRDSTSVTVFVADPVEAMFTVDDAVGCSEFPVTVTNESVGATNYSWIMGDGTRYIHTEANQPQEFTHTYINPTTDIQRRTLTLITRNAFACRDTMRTVISVYPSVNAEFNASTTDGCSPVTVDFQNQSTGAAEYFWDFGDGSSSTEANPTHIFENFSDTEKVFSVVLTATSRFGCTDTLVMEIRVKPYINTQFSFDPPVHCSPYRINITNTSVGSVTNRWSFDGGATRFEHNSDTLTRLLENHTALPRVFDVWLYGQNNYGCRDSVRQQVTVYPHVESRFTANVIQGCNPLEVRFANNSIGAANLLWNFDGGEGSSSETNPVVVFDNISTTDTAVFNVRLIATSQHFCRDTSEVQIRVFPRLKAEFTISDQNYCLNQAGEAEVVFRNTSAGGRNHYWDLGNGNFVLNNGAEVRHTFTNTTASVVTYLVRLRVENGAGCIEMVEREIVIYPHIRADFEMAIAGCHPVVATMDNRSVGAVQYIWDFGDGGNSQIYEPTHTFKNESHNINRIFTVKLIAISGYGCMDSVSKDIVVYPTPYANFEPSVISGCAPLATVFNNRSLGRNLTASWDFGDGTLRGNVSGSISHIYSNSNDSARVFTSQLIVSNPQGCRDTVTRAIKVFPEINASFALSANAGCHPLEIGITNLSTGATATTPYMWEYSNGQRSATRETLHNYVFNNFGHTQSINYTITLRAESRYGCTAQSQQQIVVHPRPDASFQPDLVEGCSPLIVNFADASTGANNYRWDFGDGNRSELAGNVQNTFRRAHDAGAGVFDINLLVSNVHGCLDTANRQILVYPDIVADFTSISEGCHPLTVNFQNRSQGVLSQQWNFGDGATTNIENPAHTFINESFTDIRTYTVSLNAVSAFGCIAERSAEVTVWPRPYSYFTVNTHQGCSPLQVRVNNLSVGGSSHSWDIAGSIELYNNLLFDREFRNLQDAPVINNLRLTTVNQFGCSRETTKEVLVFPEVVAQFTADIPGLAGCSPLKLNFENQSLRGHNYQWNFGDSVVLISQNPTKTFYTPSDRSSDYTIGLTVRSVYGCSDSIVRTARVFPVPVADIFVTPHIQQFPSSSVTAHNLSSDGDWTYRWDMGDGTRFETQANGAVTHNYDLGGIYNTRQFRVGLQVSNEFCHDSISQKVMVIAPYPVVGFSPSAQGCPPLDIQFSNISRFGTRFHWDFGDGNTSNEENPRHIFTEPGQYRVWLMVEGPGGVDSAFQTITVFEPPIADFRVMPEQLNIPYDWAQMVNMSSLASYYEWHFGDGTVSNEYEPSHLYQSPGRFDITLIVATDTDPRCYDQVTKSSVVDVEQPCHLIFPNAFTPSTEGPSGGRYVIGDPSNRVFYPVHIGLQDYLLEIYNRWGELIFRSTDINIGWDGYFQGRLAPMDVYVWRVYATCYSGRKIREVGDVTLYR